MKKNPEKKAKAEDVKICGLCGQMIIGDYEMVKTRRRTTMYFCKGMRCREAGSYEKRD